MKYDVIIDIFKFLNYEEEQALIYDCLLTHPMIGLNEISYFTRIPRSTLYNYYPRLLLDSIISESSKEGKRLFKAASPDLILEKLNEKGKKFEQNKTEFKKLIDNNKLAGISNDIFPSISYYVGDKGIQTIMRKVLKSKELLNTCFYIPEDKDDFSFDLLNKWFNIAQYKKGILTKEIIYYCDSNFEYQKMCNNSNTETKFVKKTIVKNSDHIDKYIFDTNVALINFTQRSAVLINDKSYADNERIGFLLLWNRIPNVIKKKN